MVSFWRCLFRFSHAWGVPVITTTVQGTRVVHVCGRCGKRTDRVIPI